MKKLLRLLYSIILLPFLVNAQTDGVLIDYVGNTRSNSAVLDVRSTNQGILVPRLTTGQRTGIASPANGLLVYDVTLNDFYYYDSSLPGWSPISGGVSVSSVTANNGLTSSGGTTPDITLGGSLDNPTTVSQGNNSMVFNMTGTGDFEVRDNGVSALFVKDDGSIGINNNSPDASAILDVVSKAKGMLIPRMSFAERNAIASPANSLIIFNTTSDCLEIYADGAWQSFYCSCPVLDPLQPILGPNPVCSGTTVNYSVPGVTGAATYTWTVSGVSSGNITGNGSTSISFPAPSSNTFTVSVVAANACANSTSTQTRTINAYTAVPPTPTATAAPSSLCQGGSYAYSIVNGLGSNGLGAIDYTWTITVTGSTSATLTANSQIATAGSPVVFTGTATAVTINVGATGSGNVTVSVRGNNTCGSSSTPLSWTLPVNILPSEPTSASASVSTICAGQSTNLTLNGGGGGTNQVIRWYTSSCGGTLVGTGNNFSVSPTATTTYYGRYEVPAPCNMVTSCQAVTVTVNQPSIAPTSISSTGGAVCLGTPQILTAVGGTLGTGATYQWGTGTVVGLNVIAGQTGITLTVSPTVTTSYWVRIVNTSSPCTAATGGPTVTLPINQPSVAPTNITGTTPLCSGTITVLTAVGGTLGTGANYQWGTGAVVGSNILSGQTASTLSVSPTSTTIYWVRIVNTASPCTSTTAGVTLTVTVNQPSVAPTSITGTNTICSGTSTTLTATGGTLGTGANYQWGTGSVVGTDPIVGQTGITLTVSPTSNTTYWVSIENGTAPCAITTGGVTRSVTVNNPSTAPTSISATATTLCSGTSVTLTAVGGTLGTGATYQWGTGSTIGLNVLFGATAVSYTPSPIPTANTTYWVRIVNTTSPCTATTGGVTQLITVNQPTVAPTSITGTTPICNGTQVTLTANGTLGTGASYQWGTGTTPGSNVIGGATSATYAPTPTSNTTYWVRIIGTAAPCPDNNGGVTRAIVVDNFTTASAGGDQSLCATSATLAANTPTTGNGVWSVVSGAGSFSSTTSPTATVSGMNVGANTFRWTLANGACNDSQDDVVINASAPLAAPTSVTASPSSIVAGNSSNLNATSAGNNISWYTAPSGGAPVGTSASGANFSVSPTTTTTYYAQAEPSASISYNQSFTAGATPTTQATAWCNFRATLLGSYSYTSLQVSSQYGSVTITDPAAILGIANALRTGSAYSVVVGGNTWQVTTGCGAAACGSSVELSMNQGFCACGSGMFVVRPQIGNLNWGGVGTAHCGAPSQTINVVFGIASSGCPSSTRTPVTVTVTAPSLPAQCSSYSNLADTWRATSNTSGTGFGCDSGFPAGWYRVTAPGYSQIPLAPPGVNRCGTSATGWLAFSPSGTTGVNVSGTACFHWTSSTCQWSTTASITNCGSYYVYYLNPSPVCNLRYCIQ